MSYINTETMEFASRSDIEAAYPDTSLPPVLNAENIPDGFAVVESDPMPDVEGGVSVTPGGIRVDDGRYFREWVVTPAATGEPVNWPAAIAAVRYQFETRGTDVDGVRVATDRDSQALITGAALAAMLDPDYSVRWKTQTGFVELGAQQIIAVASAVRAHVQACFDREAELLAALADDELAPEMLDEGWPDGSVPAPAQS